MKNYFYILFCASFLCGCQNMLGDVNQYQQNQNPTPTNTPLSLLRLGDRYYVQSFYENIFVPSSIDSQNPNEVFAQANLRIAIRTNSVEKLYEFGGPCDFFSSNTETCSGAGSRNLASYGPATTNRAAVSLQGIYDILSNQAPGNMAVRNVIALVRNVPYTSIAQSGIAAPTSEEIRRLFQIIYPEAEISLSTIEKTLAFSSAFAQANGNFEGWRYSIILALSTLLWQLP